ncbi:40s ribosomal protein SA [Actinidia rufa]|uniref:40s ribosomal protein SA n=1 Tax=Actinidia rufa TaxID=165716 RepID=A0A7J0G047_9ERIC|nr:40s ribosomal protein SA [Actinidia rufa]
MTTVDRALSTKEADIQMMLAAEVHLGTKHCDFQMGRYVFKRRNDGPWTEGSLGSLKYTDDAPMRKWHSDALPCFKIKHLFLYRDLRNQATSKKGGTAPAADYDYGAASMPDAQRINGVALSNPNWAGDFSFGSQFLQSPVVILKPDAVGNCSASYWWGDAALHKIPPQDTMGWLG